MRIKYIGSSNGGCATDVTIGNHYEAELNDNPDYVTITADDNGDLHCIYKGDCVVLDDRPLKGKPIFGKQPRHDCPVDPDLDDWSADEANDEFCNTQGIELIARDVEPEPEGPKSTDELRKYRFKPEIY